jgi:NADH-quinone oxidoreductase subunit L
MFRLVFLTFHGEERFHGVAAAAAHGGHGGAHAAHGMSHAAHDPGHLHDAPPAMATALIVLAIGSVVAGWIGIPHALGGHNSLGTWLEPAFAYNNCGAPVTTGELAGFAIQNCEPGQEPALASMTQVATQAPEPAVAQPAEAEPAAEGGAAHEETALELTLMGISTLIAFTGIGLAAFLWLKNRHIPEQLATQFAGVHRLLLNKYYVDEIYDAAIVQPIKTASTEGLWRGMDVKVVDGAVNATGYVVGALAAGLRLFQTGSVKSYAAGTFMGVVAILAYYLWR